MLTVESRLAITDLINGALSSAVDDHARQGLGRAMPDNMAYGESGLTYGEIRRQSDIRVDKWTRIAAEWKAAAL